MMTTTDKLRISIDVGHSAELADLLERHGDCNWRAVEAIDTYIACCYGRDGDEPGSVEIVLQEASPCGVTIYRWAERDDGGTHETGCAMFDRDESVASGKAYAEENDETPNADDQVAEILAADWFSASVDDGDVRAIIDYIEGHSDLGQGHVIVDRDGWREWVTTGYVERDAVYVGIPHGGFGSWAAAASALLRAVTADDE